jgi:hypothetical protein
MKLSLSLSLAALGAAASGLPRYIGCYLDQGSSASTRDLPVFFCTNGKDGPGGTCVSDMRSTYSGHSYAGHQAMSPELCNGMCNGFAFFGLQGGGECYCGNDYGNMGGRAADSECSMRCTGNPGAMCGNWGHNSIYHVNSTTA